MVYLVLAILSSASMAIALRLFESEEGNRYGLLLGNYITCIVLAFVLLPEKKLLPAGSGITLACGVIDGIFFIISLVLMQSNIARNGTVLTSAFSKLGLLIPLAYSVVWLGERPGVLQIAGLILVLAAIVLLNLPGNGGQVREGKSISIVLLLALLFSFGLGDTMAKVFEQVGEREQDALFFFYVFATAGILCTILALSSIKQEGKRLRLRDMLAGIAVGIPNYFASSLLLKSLVQLPAILVYPCVSTGTILVVTLFGTLLFHEKLTARKWIGLGLIAAALVFLNL